MGRLKREVSLSYLLSRRHALISLAAALFMFAGFAATQAKAADAQAEAFVTSVADQAIAIISNKSQSKAVRETAFSTLLNSNADMERIAAFCLGQFLRTPTAEQKTEYLELFKKFVVKIYLTRLDEYSNEKLVVTGSQARSDTQTLVNSQINFTTGREPVKVTWWLVKKDGGFKVFDLNVVGVWLAQEQRSSFTSVINNNGGKFEALLGHLRKQIADADAGKLPPVAGQQ